MIEEYVKTHIFAFSSIPLPSLLCSCQAVSVEGNKMVSTVTLQATAEVMKDGVICEVSNEHGTDSKTLVVSLKRGQCQEITAVMPLHLLHLHIFSSTGF